MGRSRIELPSVVVTEPDGSQTLVLSPQTSMRTPGVSIRRATTGPGSGLSLAAAGSVLHPYYLGNSLGNLGNSLGNESRPAFSGGFRGAVLLLLSSTTACALFGPPSTTLCNLRRVRSRRRPKFCQYLMTFFLNLPQKKQKKAQAKRIVVGHRPFAVWLPQLLAPAWRTNLLS